MASGRLSAWLLQRTLNAITHRWSPVRFIGRWYDQVVTAGFREAFHPDRPVTWADLNPFAKPKTEPVERWVKPDDGANP